MKHSNFKSRFVILLLGFLTLGISQTWGVEKKKTWTFGSSANTEWTASECSSYCSLYYANKSNAFSLKNSEITDLSSVDFSSVTDASISIYVTGLTNGGTNSVSVQLVNSKGTTIGSKLTHSNELKNTSTASQAAEGTAFVFSSTALVGATGYVISGVAKGGIAGTRYVLTYTEAPSNPCTVTFNGNGHGTPAKASEKEASAGAGVTLPSVTANDGWKFLGWATTQAKADAGTADAGAAGATYKPSADGTVYAVYKQLYKVTLYRNGSSTTTGWIEDDSYALPTVVQETAACEEWPFKGWSTSTVPSTTTAPSFKTSASKSSTTFYAVYGKTENSSEPVVEEITLTGKTTPSATSFTWSTNKNGGTDPAWSSSQLRLYVKNQLIITSTNLISEIIYTYSINANNSGTKPTGASVTGNNSDNGTWASDTKTWTSSTSKAKTVTLQVNGSAGNYGFTKIKVTTSGGSTTTYTTSPDCAEKYAITPSVTGSGSIQFSTDGTNWSNAIANQPEGADVYFKLVPGAGYEFGSVNLTSSIGDISGYWEKVSGKDYYYLMMPAAPVTVSATFVQPATYIILYDKGSWTSAEGGVPDPDEVTPGTNYTINSTDKLSLTGYTFKGWNTDKNATTGLTNITVNDDITLYAIFTINSYNVTFTPSITGGSIKVNGFSTSPVQVQYNSNVTIAVTTTTHYELTTLTYNGTDIKTDKSFQMPADNVEITYSFTEDQKVIVTFKNNDNTLATGGTREVYVGDPIGTLPTLTSSDAKDARSKTFVGWTEDKVEVWQPNKPTLIDASTIISEAKILNAVWAKGDGKYQQITSESELIAGNKYVIQNDSKVIAHNSTPALIQNEVALTEVDGKLTPEARHLWILAGSVDDGWSFVIDDSHKLSTQGSGTDLTLTGNNTLWAIWNIGETQSSSETPQYNTDDYFWIFQSDNSKDYYIEYSNSKWITYGISNTSWPTTGQNGYIKIKLYTSSLTDYITHSSASPLASMTLNTDNVKKNYFVGETFTSANLSATAKLEDGIEFPIEYNALTIEGPDNLSTAGEKTVTVKYTFNGATQSATYDVNAYSVTINPVYTDRVNEEPVTGNTYTWNPQTHALTFTKQAHYKFNGIEVVGADKTGSNLSYTLSNPTANVTLTATWQRLFTLTYDSKGGAAVSSVTDVTKNTTVETMPSPKFTGYDLVGWFDNEGCTGDAVTFPYAITKDETLYAKWQVKTTEITLSQTDATTKGTEQVIATYDQPMPTTNVTMPQREHYQFAGYKHSSTLYYNADGSSAKNWDKEDETVTLTAQWIINKNKVIFTNVLDGGTIKVNNQTSTINEVDYNSTVTITATPSAHYTLTALTWNGNDILSTRSFTMPDEDVTIEAIFTEDTKRTISWSVGGQIVSTTADVYDGTAFATIKTNAPTVDDDAAGDCADKFMGWATEAIDGSEGIEDGNVKWATNATTSETQNTFYAVFAAEDGVINKTYTLSLIPDDFPTAYADNTITKDAICSDDGSKISVTLATSNVMLQSKKIQFKKANTSRFYNTTNLSSITSVTTGNSSLKVYYGDSEGPSSGTTTGKPFCSVYGSNADTYKSDGVTITFKKSTTKYGHYITQCCQAPEHELAITTTALTVKMGNTLQLSTGETGNGNTIKWESKNTAVATVDQSGLVTPFGTGKATITVSQEAKTVDNVDYCEQYAEVEVEVIANDEFGISFTAAEGGSAVAKINDAITQKATTGTTVTIVATESSSDYIFDSWTVVSGGVSLTSTTANPTTFVMGSADVEITPTFYKKTVDNIAIKTAPSVTSYTTRDHLNVTGLVITATYTKHGSEDIAYAGNEDKFSFSPALDANLTAGNQQDVTVTYDDKSTTFKIDVAQYTTPYYSLVTDASQLVAGKKVVFGTKEADKMMGYYVTDAKNILGVDATYNEQRTGVEVDDVAYTVSGNATEGWHFADAQGRYIYSPAVESSNYLYAATDKQDKGTWSVSIDETTHILTMKCTGAVGFDRILLSYNTNDPGFFSCYKTTQKAVYMYIEDVKPVYVPVTSIELNETAMNIMQSKSGSLVATVGPDNATQHNVTWSIINDNANGKITVTEVGTVLVDEDAAVGATATVRATTDGTDKDGNHLTTECVITVTELETVDYMLVTTASLLQAGDIIVLGNADNSALNGAIGTDDYFKKVQATYNSAKKTMSSKYAVEITLGGNAIDGWTFTTSEGNIFASGSDGVKVSPTKEPSVWTIAIAADGTATIKENGEGYAIRYNSGNPRFKRYSAEKSIQIYSKRDTRYKRTDLVVGNYGTMCVPYAVKATDRSGATFWNIETSNTPGYTNPTSVTIVEEEGDLVAGKPYIFCATETEMAMFFSGDKYEETESVPANGLYGNLTDGTITINPTEYVPGFFFVLQQKLYECGTNCTVAPNRGWVKADEIGSNPVTAPAHVARRVIGNPNGTPTGINNLNADGLMNIQGARKYFHNNQIMIVNEGRIYNAQGIEVQ